jgi:hypothetical protein
MTRAQASKIIEGCPDFEPTGSLLVGGQGSPSARSGGGVVVPLEDR